MTKKKPATELTDDQVMRRLFPKEIREEVKKEAKEAEKRATKKPKAHKRQP